MVVSLATCSEHLMRLAESLDAQVRQDPMAPRVEWQEDRDAD
jgi:hypothetical protein